jgi:hypothetical protein
MRKILFTVSLVVGLLGGPVAAAEFPSCDEMKNFSTDLRNAADYISDTTGDFSDNPEMEKSMTELLAILDKFSEKEGDEGFTDALSSANDLWDEDEWEGDDVKKFKQAFDATAVALDRVAKKHCP